MNSLMQVLVMASLKVSEAHLDLLGLLNGFCILWVGCGVFFLALPHFYFSPLSCLFIGSVTCMLDWVFEFLHISGTFLVLLKLSNWNSKATEIWIWTDNYTSFGCMKVTINQLMSTCQHKWPPRMLHSVWRRWDRRPWGRSLTCCWQLAISFSRFSITGLFPFQQLMMKSRPCRRQYNFQFISASHWRKYQAEVQQIAWTS